MNTLLTDTFLLSWLDGRCCTLQFCQLNQDELEDTFRNLAPFDFFIAKEESLDLLQKTGLLNQLTSMDDYITTAPYIPEEFCLNILTDPQDPSSDPSYTKLLVFSPPDFSLLTIEWIT